MLRVHRYHLGVGGRLIGLLVLLAFIALVVLAIVALVRYLTRSHATSAPHRSDDARQVLRMRLARGEIDEDEFRRLNEILSHGSE